MQNDNWIKCSDRLPENETEVLVWCGMYRFAYFKNGEMWDERLNEIGKITHWQPLPKPPKESDNDAQ